MSTSGNLLQHAPDAEAVQLIELRCYSYEERRGILSRLLEALDQCGCWVAEQRATSPTQMEFRFEAHLSQADDLYGELITAGVELTRDAHLAMTWLCTLSRHRPSLATVSVRMEMNFLVETDLEMGTVSAGLA